MDYLKEYQISDDEIITIKENIEENNLNLDLFIYESEKIKKILDLFLSIGVTNLYDILITNPMLFGESLNYIENKINNYHDKIELKELLNEDAHNLRVINLY